MNIPLIEEALSVSDTSLRCQRVLDEVQPILRQLMDDFKSKYASQAERLLDYHVHTYEATLRTTMHDARNPKYASGKENTDIGKKAFVELIDKSLPQTEYSTFMLLLSGTDRKMKIVIPSSFYPYWEGVRTQRNTEELAAFLRKLPDQVAIYASDNEEVMISKTNFIPYIQKCAAEKRKPWIYFGTLIDFDQLPPTEELVDVLWNTWLQLEPIRHYLRHEAASHARSQMIMGQLDAQHTDITATLYGKEYLVKFDQTHQQKTHQHRQKFGLYDKGQLVTDGSLDFFLREPNEVIGVYVNGYGHLFNNIRTLHGDGPVPWSITKSFKFRGKDKYDISMNKEYQARAMEALAKHGYQLEGNSFVIGTWDNEDHQFVEPIEEVKKRLIMAGVLFADCTEMIHLPKSDMDSHPLDSGGDDPDENDPPTEEQFQHDFNLAAILSNVRESPYTYADAIIRDFHLNLVSLEDKHFVILTLPAVCQRGIRQNVRCGQPLSAGDPGPARLDGFDVAVRLLQRA